ncbi:hypothetical protein DL769_010698 [Monosporascus sp. CRB-8-3]|nr:hypothetical protein DL769_010698 [Monosporascus sp. CRB-8-3]
MRRTTSLTHAIRVEILERIHNVPEQHQLHGLKRLCSRTACSPNRPAWCRRDSGFTSAFTSILIASLSCQGTADTPAGGAGGLGVGLLHATTRFIDVRLRRLVQLDEIFSASPVEFIALSYVWGKDYQLRTLSGNLATFRVQLPGSEAGPDETLPKTIEDAILVTRAL